MDASPVRTRLLPLALALVTAASVLASGAVPAADASGSPEAAGFTPGAQTRFPLPDPDATPTAIATGPDGALWIAESNGGAVVRMATDGSTTRYPIPSGADPTDVAAGADGTVWWVARTDSTYGFISTAGQVTEYPLDPRAHPTAAATSADGSGWTLETGPLPTLRATRSPLNPLGVEGTFDIGHGTVAPTHLTAVGHKLWVSDPAANLILVFSQAGVYESSISLPAPGAITVGDWVYVISAGNSLHTLYEDGREAFPPGEFPGYPLITGIVRSAAGELWLSERRAERITILPRTLSVAETTVHLPDPGAPSDIVLGLDEAIWYTTIETDEVVRIAADYEAPGLGLDTNFVPPPVRAYVGEPLGPVVVSDRGSGAVTGTIGGALPAGMSVDPTRPFTLIGRPNVTGTATHTVDLSNVYYNGLEARVQYERSIVVRAAPGAERLAGADRYETAVAASRARFPSTARRVYVVSGEKFADALSAGPVAIAAGAPLLLTPATTLPASVEAEIKRLQPTEIIVAGGSASVSQEVIALIARAGGTRASVTRIAGADRYEVSQKLVATAPTSSVIYLASGQSYPDALAAAPAAHVSGSAVLLVDGSLEALPDSTMRFLVTTVGATQVRLAGGPATLSESIRRQLEEAVAEVSRLGGADRYATASIINRAAFN
ncbi:MAG: cell wall-binding repeat-containing protein, partial [Herbiconiux sp.]|nr:cell wall-binding repeat-containing protein [Herbiconiux sp.]